MYCDWYQSTRFHIGELKYLASTMEKQDIIIAQSPLIDLLDDPNQLRKRILTAKQQIRELEYIINQPHLL